MKLPLALQCLLEGFSWLTHPSLRLFVLLPLAINCVLFSLAFVLGYHTLNNAISQLIPDWLTWLEWLLWPLFFIGFLVMGFFSFTLLANLIAAPFYSQLASKTLSLVSGQTATKPELPWISVFLGELKRSGYLLLRTLPLLLLFLIPVVNLIAPLLWAVLAAWGMAMEFMAYPLEERGFSFDQQKQFIQQHRWQVLSFGGITGLGLTVPLLNLIITQAAVIGATLYVHRLNPSLPTTQETQP
jgi:CysZ protein